MKVILSVLVVACLSGCAQLTGAYIIRPGQEIIMQQGDTIDAAGGNGPLRIRAGKGTTRYITWDSMTWKIPLVARSRPFQGRFGLYRPGDFRLPEHKGIWRANVEETWYDFPSYEALYKEISGYWTTGYKAVYTSDGLIVGWDTVPGRHELNVDVWQFTVQGKKPSNLKGARNDLIRFLDKDGNPTTSFDNRQNGLKSRS